MVDLAGVMCPNVAVLNDELYDGNEAGEHRDRKQPFKEAAQWLAHSIRGARFQELSPARHCSILEQPHAFRRAFQDFLQ